MEERPKTATDLAIAGFEAADLGYGDFVSHSDINGWSGLEYPDLDGIGRSEQKKAVDEYTLARLSIVEGVRSYLLDERQMYMQSVHGSGYRIVAPKEQTEAAVKKGMKQIQKGLKHAVRGTEQVNVSMLNASEREYNSSVKARLSGLQRMIGKKRDYLGID